MSWINAKYNSHCAECEQDIKVGDRIVYDDHKAYCKHCGEEIDGVDPLLNKYGN